MNACVSQFTSFPCPPENNQNKAPFMREPSANTPAVFLHVHGRFEKETESDIDSKDLLGTREFVVSKTTFLAQEE